MILVGLTGGIGSGKSTVSALLAEQGAVIVDADQVTRAVQQPGSPVIAELADRFGEQILHPDGSLDRQALADIVFTDGEALGALNKIVHPAVGREMVRLVAEQVPTEHVVVLDIPLLTERPRQGLQAIIVVDVPVEVQVDRLVHGRGFDEADARARIARQATREQRLSTATFVVDNSGPIEQLTEQVATVWQALTALPQLGPDFVYAPEAAG